MLLQACAPTGEIHGDSRHQMVTPSFRESLGSVLSFSQPAAGERTVEVRATGATREQARDEAVRTALQSTVSQLVITDRLVENEDVVRDQVFATQNGFVTAFELLEETRTEFGEYEYHARVTVSEDTILNYVAFQQGTESSLDGASLFAEVQRGAGQRRVLDDMFRRFARGYPWDVVTLDMQAIQPVTGHGDRVVARVVADSDSDYFIAMQQFLERVARASYRIRYRFSHGFGYPTVDGFVRSDVREERFIERGHFWRVPSTYPTSKVCMVPRTREREVRFLGSITMDVNEAGETTGRCYIFPPGDYQSFFWDWNGLGHHAVDRVRSGNGLLLMVTFLDNQGLSAIRPNAANRIGSCMLVTPGSNYPEPGFYMTRTQRWHSEVGLPFRANRQSQWSSGYGDTPSTLIFSDIEAKFNVVFRTEDVDFERVTSFRGRPLFLVHDRNRNPLLMSDIAGPPVPASSLCDELLAQGDG